MCVLNNVHRSQKESARTRPSELKYIPGERCMQIRIVRPLEVARKKSAHSPQTNSAAEKNYDDGNIMSHSSSDKRW
jgi:hypothetical protein